MEQRGKGKEGRDVPSSVDMSPSLSTQAFIRVRERRRSAARRARCSSAYESWGAGEARVEVVAWSCGVTRDAGGDKDGGGGEKCSGRARVSGLSAVVVVGCVAGMSENGVEGSGFGKADGE